MGQRIAALMGSGLSALSAEAISGFESENLTATGTVQGDALRLAADHNYVTTVASGTGVILPSTGWNKGDMITIMNLGANTLKVYPQTGSAIGAAAADASVNVTAGSKVNYYYISATQWI